MTHEQQKALCRKRMMEREALRHTIRTWAHCAVMRAVRNPPAEPAFKPPTRISIESYLSLKLPSAPLQDE